MEETFVNGKLLKMVTQIDGSFGPVVATAAAAVDAAAAAAAAAPRQRPQPRRHRPAVKMVKKNNWPFFRFGPF